ncbi:acyl carrier protein [Kitasatospora sp. NA04385]|uniref:acyl carrier protein n=1 Tax=Kitasatospora sp. NA04385 TaxID=2742135 RepID=UPI0015900DF6|nr:acyl carrier protein [Kitasatospora sp. NA04385]QKW23076.1 acyl carrier protein [Kitasatospora sp. NA04385]
MSESAPPTAALPATAPADPEVRERIRRGIEQVLPRVLGVELADIPENACFFDDYGLTSSGIVELVLDIEETLAIQVDVEHLVVDDVRTLDSLTDYVVGHHADED